MAVWTKCFKLFCATFMSNPKIIQTAYNAINSTPIHMLKSPTLELLLRVVSTKKDTWHLTCNRNAPFNGIIVTLIFGTIQGKTPCSLSRIIAKNIFQISSMGVNNSWNLKLTVETLRCGMLNRKSWIMFFSCHFLKKCL